MAVNNSNRHRQGEQEDESVDSAGEPQGTSGSGSGPGATSTSNTSTGTNTGTSTASNANSGSASTAGNQAARGTGGASDRPSDGERIVEGIGSGIVRDVVGDIIKVAVKDIVPTANNDVTGAISNLAIGLLSGQELDQIAQNYIVGRGVQYVGAEMLGKETMSSIASAQATTALDFAQVNITDGISFNVASIGIGIVGSMLIGEMFDSEGAAKGAQIGALLGNFIPIPIVGSLIGQFFGAIIGDMFDDGPANRYGTFVNSSDEPINGFQEGESSIFGHFGTVDTEWFGEDQEAGAASLRDSIIKLDQSIVNTLDMTPEQIAAAKENLQHTNYRYDFGMEHTGWHPSNRVITDRVSAIIDAVDPRVGDVIRFSNPDGENGVKPVLQQGIALAAAVQQDRVSDQQLQAIRDAVVDKFYTALYNEDPNLKNPAEAYGVFTNSYNGGGYAPLVGEGIPDYLQQGQQEWTAKQEYLADQYRYETQQLQDQVIASADPAVVEAYNEYAKDLAEHQSQLAMGLASGKGVGLMAPPEPPPGVAELREALDAAVPNRPAPLFVANPLVTTTVQISDKQSATYTHAQNTLSVEGQNHLNPPDYNSYSGKGFWDAGPQPVDYLEQAQQASSSYPPVGAADPDRMDSAPVRPELSSHVSAHTGPDSSQYHYTPPPPEPQIASTYYDSGKGFSPIYHTEQGEELHVEEAGHFASSFEDRVSVQVDELQPTAGELQVEMAMEYSSPLVHSESVGAVHSVWASSGYSGKDGYYPSQFADPSPIASTPIYDTPQPVYGEVKPFLLTESVGGLEADPVPMSAFAEDVAVPAVDESLDGGEEAAASPEVGVFPAPEDEDEESDPATDPSRYGYWGK